ncbi:MAG: hypothetical protein GY869_31330, partial [Planctomycetes bacterium]|nr:hypothetical protein [Planctomycetota bacterium]
MSSSTPRRCRATKKNGQPCGGYAVRDGHFCVIHDPRHIEKMAAGRRKGGKATAARLAPRVLDASDFAGESVADVVKLLTETVNGALTGDIDLKVANINTVKLITVVYNKTVTVDSNLVREFLL